MSRNLVDGDPGDVGFRGLIMSVSGAGICGCKIGRSFWREP